MASELEAKATAIEAFLDENWPEGAKTPISWPGVDFDPPDGPWLKVDITWGDGFMETIGGSGTGTNQVVGVLTLNLFDVPGQGARQIDGYADELRDLFNRAEVEGVRFDAPSGPKPTRRPNQGTHWLQRTIDVPFAVVETI